MGAHVFYLKRWAIGPVRLDAALAPGAFRPLTPEAVSYTHLSIARLFRPTVLT